MSALLNELKKTLAQADYESVRSRVQAELQRHGADPQLEQFLGLAHRGLLDSAEAYSAFARAAIMVPRDPLIAHSLARTALEAGYPASELFRKAAALAPTDPAILLGRAAALSAEGEGELALDELTALLHAIPEWTDGHKAYAQLLSIWHPEAARDQSIRTALRKVPRSKSLHQACITIHMGAHDYASGLDAVRAAQRVLGNQYELDQLEAMCLCEIGECERAFALFASLPLPAEAEAAVWPIRTLIRMGRHRDALKLAEREYPQTGMGAIWPYRALLWRLLGDPRWDWLEGDERLIRTFDLTESVGSLAELGNCLRAIHRGSGEPLNQSVRGGTQTDGQLFARADPVIRKLRTAISGAVASYVAQLPPPDPTHPTLSVRREPQRFSGSWSVRLLDEGYHHDHFHSHGWLSSAFYVSLPDLAAGLPEAGALAFGENRKLLPDLAAFKVIAPKPGSLTIFPSTMWHGTRPFDKGERLTVAFDIAIRNTSQ